MTRKDILSVAMKILGIYFLVKAIHFAPFLVTVIQGLQSEKERVFLSFAIAQVGAVLVSFAAAVILLKWSGSIAGRLTKDYESEPTTMGRWLGKDELLEVAFCVVGVVILADALPRIPQLIIRGILREPIFPDPYGLIAALVAQLGIGLYLTLKAKGLVGLLRKLRGGIISSPDNSESPKSP